MEWLAAIEELERSNSLLSQGEGEEFGRILEQRGKAVERIAALAAGPVSCEPGILARLSTALAGGAEIRRQLALRRGQIGVEVEELNRAGALVRRLQDPLRSASRIDCRG